MDTTVRAEAKALRDGLHESGAALSDDAHSVFRLVLVASLQTPVYAA
jgi:hypothetical protein